MSTRRFSLSSSNEDDEPQTLSLKDYGDKLNYEFDYELNSVKLDEEEELNSKMYYYDKRYKDYRIINYNSFNDKLKPLETLGENEDKLAVDKDFIEKAKESPKKNVKSANFIKRLVSKQKRRHQDENFDLDLTYITDRVIAMGFPSTGCETVYRNSVSDVVNFFSLNHNNNVKIYNLCLEKDRIYTKKLFENSKVGLFPATDHNPCPIKLILEFCVDICLYLMNNPGGVAAVHCKAGKGRTGVMICSYLIFSRLCENSEKAFRYYARIRTKDNTGLTIPSQKRYIRYFETFLEANFCPPYIFLIPKIIKTHFSHIIGEDNVPNVTNILNSFQKEKSYFISANTFKLKSVRVGPLQKGKTIKLKICNFINNNFDLHDHDILLENSSYKDLTDTNLTYYELSFNPELIIHSDIKIYFSGFVNFYIWVNLWFSSWETIKKSYDKSNLKVEELKEVNKEANLENSEYKLEDEESKRLKSLEKNNPKNTEKNNDKIKLYKNIPRKSFISYDLEKTDKYFQSYNKVKSIISDNDCNEHKRKSQISAGNIYENISFNKYDKNIYNKMMDNNGGIQSFQGRSLYEIIFKLKHNSNLNELIDHINESLNHKIDPKNLWINLGNKDLDKFSEKDQKAYSNIQVFINYSLMNKKKSLKRK